MRSVAGLMAGIVLVVAPAGPLAGQWGLSVEVGVARFGGTARDSLGARVGPYRPTTFGLRVDRTFGATRACLTLTYARTGIAGEQYDIAVVDYDAASLVELTPEVSIRFARFGAGAVARVEGGPAVDVWDVDGDTRTRLGARATVALEWPLTARASGSLRATGVVSPSIMNAEETPAGVERRATRRGGVSLGVRYRL